MLRRRDVVVVCAIAVLAAPELEAQRGFMFVQPRATVTVFGGFAQARAGSDLFDFTTDELTLDRSDFGGTSLGGDLAIRATDRFDVVIGVSNSSSRSRSEFRDWVGSDDQPIEQVTKFRRMPIVASLRFHPLPRGRQVGSLAWIPATFDPWVGAGVGRMSYDFRQTGDFIDYETDPDNPEIFTDDFRSKGWTGVFQGSVGAGWSFSARMQLSGELRYIHSSAELGGDFVGFEAIDLSGLATSLGLSFRL